jgi:galactose-1-phosphate uridylyltransferase
MLGNQRTRRLTAVWLIGEPFMKIVDFHTHIYPDHIAQKATQSICGG